MIKLRIAKQFFLFKSSLFMKMFIVLIMALAFQVTNVFANHHEVQQGITVTGTVVDNDGEPVPGVNVTVKGATIGVITSSDGKYSITVPDRNSVLTFSFLGFKTQEITVGDQTVIPVMLLDDYLTIDEVIVVGYGTQKKSDVTGAISSLSRERLENIPAASVSQLLQGAVAGLNFTTNSSSSNPDEDNVMFIRGRNSITASNEPLVILDGVPFNGSLGEIAPGDIQSIEILKDASSAAIYGSRAANGVILITTKQGKKGKAIVKYDVYFSLQSPTNFPRMMDIDEYVYYQSLRPGGGLYDDDDPSTWNISDYELETYRMMKNGEYPKYTWADVILRTGQSQRHQISVSGGGDKNTFNISAYIQDTKGVVQRDNFKKYNLRSNVTIDISQWLTLGTLNTFTYSDNSGSVPKFVDSFNKSPLWRPWNPDGSININPAGPNNLNRINPIESNLYDDLNLAYTGTSTEYLLMDLGFVPSLKGLTYKLTFSGQFALADKANYMPTTTLYGGIGQSEISNRIRSSLMLENLFNYQQVFNDKHSIFLTGMYSWEEKKDKSNAISGEGFANDFLSWYGTSQAAKQVTDYKYSKYDLISLMFRGQYTYDSRYGITYTIRRDGASVFGADTKWGTFMSGAAIWNIHNEEFFKNSSLNSVIYNMKLRASYGINGNQAILPYNTIAQMDNSFPFNSNETSDYVDGGKPAPGFNPSSLATPKLSWETTKVVNLGLDFGLFKNRVNGSVDIYRNHTYDLLLKRKISSIHGLTEIVQNIGKTQNQGIDFTLNSNNISGKKFSWSTNLTFSYNECKILQVYGDLEDEIADNGKLRGDLASKWFVGQPINVNYNYYITGTWQTHEASVAARYGALPGYAKYDDYNNNGIYDPDDRQIIGSSDPSTLIGLTNTFTYKGFNLSCFLYTSLGAMKSNVFYDNSSNNAVWHDWWTPDNPTNKMWSPDNQANSYYTGTGDRPTKYENANFMRVKDITLGYTIPKKYISKMWLSKLDVYASARNPWTVTSFNGLDPEMQDGRKIPMNRELIFGLRCSF